MGNYMDHKLETLQQILDNMTEDSGFYGAVISSEEGLIIINSNHMDPKIEIEPLAAKAASILNNYEIFSDNPEDITITYPNKKIFIRKVSTFNNTENSVILIAIMPNNMRYYRRKVNKIANNVIRSIC